MANEPSVKRDVLRESEERYRRLAEDTPVLICTFLPDGTLTYVNTAYCEYFQKSPGELIGKSFLDLIPDDEARQQVVRNYMSLTPEHPATTYEHRIVDFQGRDRWQRWTDRAFFDEEGKAAYFQSVGDDITERKIYEERVNLLSAAFEAAADATIITDRAGIIKWVNPAFTQLTGYLPEEAIGKNPREILNSGRHDQAFFKGLWQTILSGRTWRGEMVNRKKDGSLYPEEQTITPVRDAKGRISHFIGIKHDITDRKQAEEELRELRERFYLAQKMESIGRLAGGIAHDMNNMLVPIRGYVDMILSDFAGHGRHISYLHEIRNSADRATELTKKILAFGRGLVLRTEVLDINAVLDEYKRILRPLIGSGVAVELNLEPNLKRIKADRVQLEQVIMNLALNARDAMPDGGLLTIETANAVIDEGNAAGQEGMYPGSYVRIRVADNGYGMATETRMRIFEPFFTTRETGKGRGLGLAIVYGIVKQHRGHVLVESEPGRGTVVEVFLPVESKDTAVVAPKQQEFGLASKTATVLVVEDDPQLRSLVEKALRAHGFETMAAHSAEKGVELVSGYEGTVDLLVTDVLMSGMNGTELYQNLKQRHGDLKVLFMSGYTGEVLAVQGIETGQDHYLQKPFAIADLMRKVRATLADVK